MDFTGFAQVIVLDRLKPIQLLHLIRQDGLYCGNYIETCIRAKMQVKSTSTFVYLIIRKDESKCTLSLSPDRYRIGYQFGADAPPTAGHAALWA